MYKKTCIVTERWHLITLLLLNLMYTSDWKSCSRSHAFFSKQQGIRKYTKV